MTLAAVAALALTACAKFETEKPVVDEPIAFGAYAGNALTKAGATGEMTTATLATAGFGVFAYQTNGNYAAGIAPNFMYNTAVTGSGNPLAWTYSPVKYWPNQVANGKTDSQNAQATEPDKVSFFAYGPRVDHSASLGSTGITAISANTATTDPKVTYTVSNDLANQVDLVWGVYSGSDPWTNVAGTTNTPESGKPYLNLQKPAIGTAVHFYFKHALSQIKLQAVAAYNQTSAGGTAKNNVKITIASVELKVAGMKNKAVLNLNNTTANTPLWEDADGATTGDLTLTVSGTNINTTLKDLGPNTAANQPTGVTASEADVIASGKYFTVIPKTTSTTINVKVTYYVTTDDTDLTAGYSRVENVISQNVTFADGLLAGKKNTIKMILGVSEVKFEAEVEGWTDGTTQTVDLPINS